MIQSNFLHIRISRNFIALNIIERNFSAVENNDVIGFDIISLGFQTDKGLTIVPVVSDPINVIPDLEPGGDILDDTNGVPWLTIAILLGVSIGGIVVTRIIKNEIRKSGGKR